MMAAMPAVVVMAAAAAACARVHAAQAADRRAAYTLCLTAHAAPPAAVALSAYAHRAAADRAHAVGHTATAAAAAAVNSTATAAAESIAKAADADAAAGCYTGCAHGKHGRRRGRISGAVRDAVGGTGTVDGHRRAKGGGAIGRSHRTEDMGDEGHLLVVVCFFILVLLSRGKARRHEFLSLCRPFHINTLFSLP